MKAKCIGVAMLLAASTAWTPAFAADLGGDCCADLEERVAELEATTARKGNRKVSLTISGQVNELVYWWDNGDESNVYVGTSGFSNSRFRFTGDAKISADWSAGYMIEVQVPSAGVQAQTVNNDDLGGSVSLRHSFWYLKSKTLGKISVGQTSFATDDIQSSVSVGGAATATQGNLDSAPGMALAFGGGSGILVREVFDVRDVDRGNVVRYDSPSLAGFVVSASWGEDDRWDVALRYAGEFGGFKLAAAIGYHEDREPEQGQPANYNEIRTAGGILHVPTGLFVEGGWMQRDFDPTGAQPALVDDFTYWYLHAGIYQKFFAIGKTSIFGEYGEAESSAQAAVRNFVSNEGTYYGIGVQQYVDAAAMEIYLGWRHFEADLVNAAGAPIASDDVETVYTGARIKF